MKIQQLNNIRKKSLITIYASLKKKKTLLSRYGREFNIFDFINSSGNIEVLFYPTSATYMVEKFIINRKLVRLKLRVKQQKSLNRQNLRASFKLHTNVYTLVGVK